MTVCPLLFHLKSFEDTHFNDISIPSLVYPNPQLPAILNSFRVPPSNLTRSLKDLFMSAAEIAQRLRTLIYSCRGPTEFQVTMWWLTATYNSY